MSTVADKLTALHGIKADLFAATGEKELDTTGKTLETLHELWSGISGGTLQAKSVVPSSSDVEVTPDAGYNALSAVNIAVALNLKPWNIRKGKTLFGITGTAEIAVSTDVPPDIPAQKDDADDAYKENVGDSPTDSEGNALDMMVLADDDGNITYGYFVDGTGVSNGNGTALYNGVELPDIDTVWTDKDTYPYAMIFHSDNIEIPGYYYLKIQSSPMVFDGSKFVYTADGVVQSYHILRSSAELDEFAAANGTTMEDLASMIGATLDTFVLNNTISNVAGGYIEDVSLIWTSHDILNADGKVHLAASEPISLNYNTIIRFNGNTEGMVTTTMFGIMTMVKVSDSIITADQLRNCVVALKAIDTSVAKDEAIDVANPPEGMNVVVEEYVDWGLVALMFGNAIVFGISNPDAVSAESGFDVREAGTYILANYNDIGRVSLLAYNSTTYPSEFTITRYDPTTTDFSAVGWRRLSYHTTGELAGKWTYDDFSTTPSTGGNYLKNIIQCSREKLYYNGVEVWPNNRYGGEST